MNVQDEYMHIQPYHVSVAVNWFLRKNVFVRFLSEYRDELKDSNQVSLRLDAGNMIYQMMCRLKPYETSKQDLLIYSYRNLVYKLSFVQVRWHRRDINCLHFYGNKQDVMWALCFLTEVYPIYPLVCKTIPESKSGKSFVFQLQKGCYIGDNIQQSKMQNDDVPNIWATDEIDQRALYQKFSQGLVYQNKTPDADELFALPDGRRARYVPTNQRFLAADKYGASIDAQMRHDISASVMKDFEDLVRNQTKFSFETYQRRYQAFMSRVQILESQIQGFDVSVYNSLPIAEKGLPLADKGTVLRTDMMDKDSLLYIIDQIKSKGSRLTDKEKKRFADQAIKSVVARIRGYNVEYYMYMQAGTPNEVCRQFYMDCYDCLYEDFAQLDSYNKLTFPSRVYKILCNGEVSNTEYVASIVHTIRMEFKRGYLDFLVRKTSKGVSNGQQLKMYQRARQNVSRYMK